MLVARANATVGKLTSRETPARGVQTLMRKKKACEGGVDAKGHTSATAGPCNQTTGCLLLAAAHAAQHKQMVCHTMAWAW